MVRIRIICGLHVLVKESSDAVINDVLFAMSLPVWLGTDPNYGRNE